MLNKSLVIAILLMPSLVTASTRDQLAVDHALSTMVKHDRLEDLFKEVKNTQSLPTAYEEYFSKLLRAGGYYKAKKINKNVIAITTRHSSSQILFEFPMPLDGTIKINNRKLKIDLQKKPETTMQQLYSSLPASFSYFEQFFLPKAQAKSIDDDPRFAKHPDEGRPLGKRLILSTVGLLGYVVGASTGCRSAIETAQVACDQLARKPTYNNGVPFLIDLTNFTRATRTWSCATLRVKNVSWARQTPSLHGSLETAGNCAVTYFNSLPKEDQNRALQQPGIDWVILRNYAEVTEPQDAKVQQ